MNESGCQTSEWIVRCHEKNEKGCYTSWVNV